MAFRWGILATGNIAGSMAQALQVVEDAELLAVGSRSQASADAFGDRWRIPRRYASYEALAADPNIDIVYIATPHNLHYDNMKLCFNAGKHVLCEKPLTLNAPQATECIALAREKGLFLMEAIWMRFFPALAQVRQWLADGVIGDVRLVQAGFCFNLPFDPAHRLYNRELGGGALLDLGIYPLSFTTMLFGFPDEVYGKAQIGETDVDELNTMTLIYNSNITVQLTSSMRVNKPREAFIVGNRGYIKVHDIFFRPDQLTLHVNGEEPQTVNVPFRGNGYPHEVEEVHACLRDSKLESSQMPLDETLYMMQLMDNLRAQWGIHYPGETI
ncbi:Gfo/Idh/MocA family protein [Candidatus Leptofilum sp.]|uniref:Gfo/Idh/MocA family protein n=1 Tax=Candidatus Leptofilum sp. TaxID=3241576 RepID=UPI003B5A42BC